MDNFEYKSYIEGFKAPKNTNPRYIKIADILLMPFCDYSKSANDRFKVIEDMCRWGVYLVGEEECKKIVNLVINNIPNVIKDENDIKYYQRNLRRYKKYYLTK